MLPNRALTVVTPWTVACPWILQAKVLGGLVVLQDLPVRDQTHIFCAVVLYLLNHQEAINSERAWIEYGEEREVKGKSMED